MSRPTSTSEIPSDETKYAELSDDEESIDIALIPRKPYFTSRRRWYLAAIVASILFIVVGLFFLDMSTTRAAPSEIINASDQTNCGSTASDARARGCFYEPMQRSWIPADCYFPEPSDEYQPFDDREWYADEERTQLVNAHQMEMLRNGDDYTAYTRYFHHEHCLYAWRKMAIAVEYQKPMIDTKSADLHHTTHCAKIIAKMIVEAETHTFNNSASFTYSPLMFQTCVPLNWK